MSDEKNTQQADERAEKKARQAEKRERDKQRREAAKKYLTPTDLGLKWGVGGEKVLALIHSGQLKAVNLAVKVNGRPRFRISESEIHRFLEVRSSKPPIPKERRRRRAAVTTGKEFF